MKAFAVILIIFVIVVIVVFQTGYYSHSEASHTALPAKAEIPIHKPVEHPETKIVYVPQVIEKVYVKEVIHTERVVYHTETPRESYQPVSYNSAQPGNYGSCSSFTGEARDNCNRTVREGGTARQYQAKITYYGGIR